MLGAFNGRYASALRKRSTAQNSSSSETIPALERAPERTDMTPNGDADIVWGKTPSGNLFKVPTTHHTLTLIDPRYPKSHFDLMNLALLISQVVLFLLWPRSFSRRFFFVSFVFWRAAYNAGLGWILTKQSKRKWVVREVHKRGWLDDSKRPEVRAWVRQQLSVKMGRDYDFDDLPLEYNTWLLFRQVVDIILLNDFVSYCMFAFACFRVPDGLSQVVHITRWVAGLALIAFNWWVKTEAHHVVKDYGWYWGDCFFTRGGLVFDGVFEMAPHPMYSVGYAGFYGLSLIVGSYALLFVSMAAHAAQFAFLALFENPHIERLYGERKLLAERKPIPLSATQCLQRATAIQRAAATQRIRSFSAASVSSAGVSEETAIDPDGPVFDRMFNPTGGLDNGVAGSDTPTRMAKVTKHDLLNQYFRKDVVVWSNLDWLRTSDFQLTLLTTYTIVCALLTPIVVRPAHWALALHLTHALLWRLFHTFGLGLLLQAQSRSKFVVRHFVKNYYYLPEEEVKAATVEAFDNWKKLYNCSLVMTYISFAGFAYQTYSIPSDWTVGDQLLRHTLGGLLIALHIWAARESYEVLGMFGWFFGDFFIEDFPTSLSYTGIYRFLNNPEKTMSGAALFGLALISGSKAVFALAVFSHLSHWWFLSYVEGPHMKRLYGDSLRKDAGLTRVLKTVTRKHAEVLDKHVPELTEVAQDLKKRLESVYGETAVVFEDLLARSRPRVRELVLDTTKAFKRRRYTLMYTPLSTSLQLYDANKYHISVVPTNPDGLLRFHWGEPISVVWRGPGNHSRRDWVGIYPLGANRSKLLTKISSLGRWVPIYDEEWEGDLPLPLTDANQMLEEDTDCGEVVFKKDILPWRAGEYEIRYHQDGKYNVLALVGPIQIYLDRPEGLDFSSIRSWLLKIVTLALDSDLSLIPRSSALPGTSAGAAAAEDDDDNDDFCFWSERQAQRIANAIQTVLDIEFAPEVIVADANVSTLTRRILASKQLLEP